MVDHRIIMKEVLIAVCSVSLLIACSRKTISSRTPAAQKISAQEKLLVPPITDHPDYKTGFQLIEKSDCMTCHRLQEAFVAPSYRDVAMKYKSFSDTIVQHLARRVISGGSGVWGPLPMTPHRSLSHQDAEAMVRYILLFKN